jgi:signal transduction histidine kinase
MPSNPWQAVDATMSPGLRARELRRAWDDFVGNGRLDTARLPIAESWQRSRAAGIDPVSSRAPTLLGDRDEVAARGEAHPLETAAPLVREWLGAVAHESDHVIVVSDAEGLLLWVEGSAKVRSAAADTMNFVEGALWSEAGAGTNAIGTALAADHPVQVHAAEHFSEIVHGWTCSAAPVHDPETGQLIGVIDLTGRMRTAHPHGFAVALATAHAVEADLRVRLRERDARLSARYLTRLNSGSEHRALVSVTGRVIADHPEGFLQAERLVVPPGGGELILPSGLHAFAEVVGDEEVFIVRALQGTSGSRPIQRVVVDDTRPQHAQIEGSWLEDEQSALRRVATLVAHQAAADEIFASVAAEVARLLGADRGAVCRYESDESMTVMAYWSEGGRDLPIGTNVRLDGDSVAAAVRRSGGPARFGGYEGFSGPVIELTDKLRGMPHSTVAAPIVVDRRIWGTILASSTKSDAFSSDTELRIMGFAELVATAISNAVGRAELAASRARIVATADETRRRIERDLHDGTQQRLVSLALKLRATVANVPSELSELRAELSHAASGLAAAVEDLQEISRGIHPTILSKGGLEPALRNLCARSAVPVELDVRTDRRLPGSVEVAAYYVVSEALTNVSKHARASTVRVAVQVGDAVLHLAIRDDGVGGADPRRGSGLIGLRDRVDAMGGTIVVESPVGAGTSLFVALPVE